MIYGKNIQKVFEIHLSEENTWIQDTESDTRMENYIISTLITSK